MNALQENGFIILKDIFSEDLLKKVRETADNIFMNHDSEQNKTAFAKYYLPDRKDQGVMYDVFFRYPIFSKMVLNDTILDELEKILGSNIFLYENSLLRKPKNSSNEVPWHQDFINRPDEPKKYIVWIAIDDVTIKNGALKVIPGSHKHGFFKYFTVPGETHHTRLELTNFDTSKFTFVELKAGDVLIFDQLLVHSSDRTPGEDPRRAYRFACQGFDMFYTPRCIPFVLRGGEPQRIPINIKMKQEEVHTITEVKPRPHIAKRIIRRIIRELTQ